MKRFIPLILWFVLSVPFLYFVRDYLIYRFPKYSTEILMVSVVVVLVTFFIIKDQVLSYPKKKDGGEKEDK